jgi:hypothetical protein
MAELISIGMVCPKCGQQLIGPFGKNKAKLGDMLTCPVHGHVGRIEELTQKFVDDTAQRVQDAMYSIFKK